MKLLQSLVVAIVVSAVLINGAGSTTAAYAQPVAGSGAVTGPSDQIENSLRPGTIARGIYRPSFPNDLAAMAEYERTSQAKMEIVHWFALWGGWKSAFSQDDIEVVSKRGSLPMITWEPWTGQANDPSWSLRDAILSGRNDAYIESWAKGLAAYGGPLLLRFAHEMHQQTYPWAVGVNGNTAEEYVAAWRYVRDIFTRNGAVNVLWVWNPNTLGRASAAEYEPLYRSLYPGDDYVDWVGLDVYNTGPDLDWGAPSWRGFADILSEPYAAVTAITDKPLILPEVGSAETGGSKADWISDALQVQLPSRFSRVRALVWFDIDKEERWALNSSPQSLASWNASPGQAWAGR